MKVWRKTDGFFSFLGPRVITWVLLGHIPVGVILVLAKLEDRIEDRRHGYVNLVPGAYAYTSSRLFPVGNNVGGPTLYTHPFEVGCVIVSTLAF